MVDSAKISFDTCSNDGHKKANAILEELAAMLVRASLLNTLQAGKAVDERSLIQYHVVGAHILSSINTLASILTLTKGVSVQVREAVALSRGFYETCLMGSFCALDDGTRASRSELYAIYKTFRRQTVYADLGPFSVKVSHSPRLDRKHPKVKEALEMFGGSSGVRQCFTDSREDMISTITAVDRAAGSLFKGVEGMIFDLSSEIIHGSYYGWQTFHRGILSPQDDQNNLMSHYETVFFSICLSAAAFGRSLSLRMLPLEYFKSIEAFVIGSLEKYAEGFKE